MDNARAVGSRRHSIQLERFHFSQRKFFRSYFNSQVRTRCWRKNKKRWKTNSFLRTSQSDVWERSRRRMAKRRLHETEKRTLSKQVETLSGRCVLGLFLPEHKTKDYNSGRHGRMPLSCTVLCQQNASTRWFLEMGNESCSRDSGRLDLHQKLYSKVLGKKQRQQQQQQQHDTSTSGSASARSWQQSANFLVKGWKKIQATQWRSKKPLAAGNCCGVLCQTSLMLKKSLNLKSTSELKELVTM